MTEPLRKKDLGELISRIQRLSDLDKFEIFHALRKDLAGELSAEHPENTLMRERQEALAYIEKAAKHLKLPLREAPTKAQFDQVAEELNWEWNGAKINRLWERWRMATDAYLGTRRIGTPAARERAKRLRGTVSNTPKKHFEGLRSWLATKPEVETHAAYDAFADAYNASLPEGQIPLARASTVARGLPVSWSNAIKVARKELTLERAISQELAESLPATLDDKTLVGLPQLSRIFKASTQVVRELTQADPKFPVPVAHLDGHAGWLYEDVKLYRRNLATPKRAEDEYQYSYISLSELLALLERKERPVRRAIREQAWSRVPQPEGELGVGIPYWRREKVEAWIAHANNASQTPTRKPTRSRP
jgi:hypothetical protein